MTDSTEHVNDSIVTANSPMKDETTILAAIKRSREEYWAAKPSEAQRKRQPLTGNAYTSDAILLNVLKYPYWPENPILATVSKSNSRVLRAGISLLQHRRYGEAIACFSRVSRDDYASAIADFYTGAAHLECGELVKALDSMPYAGSEALDGDVSMVESIELFQGIIGVGLEDMDVASEGLAPSLDWSPLAEFILAIDDLRAWSVQPVPEATPTKFEEIERLVRHIGMYDDGVPYVHFFLGRALLEFDMPHEAELALTKAIEENPPLDETWFFLNMAHRQLGNADAAAADLRRAEELTTGISAHAERWWQEWQARLDRRRHPPHPWKSADGRLLVPADLSTSVSSS